MIKLGWFVAVAVVVAATVSGCGGGKQPGGPPGGDPSASGGAPPVPAGMSGPVSDVQARCGVQGVFWQGTWWIVNPPIQTVRNQSPSKVLSGQMTATAENLARFDSPDLVAPQVLSRQPYQVQPLSPPYQLCAPIAGQ